MFKKVYSICLSFILLAVFTSSVCAEDLYVASRANGKVLCFDSEAGLSAEPERDISGATKTTLGTNNLYGLFLSNNELFVTDEGTDFITIFDATDNGDVPPKRTIKTPGGELKYPRGIFIYGGEIFVTDDGDDSVLVFNVSDGKGSVGVKPKRRITNTDATTGFNIPTMCFVDGNDLYVVDAAKDIISVFSTTDDEETLPKRTITIAGMSNTRGLWIDGGTIYVGCSYDGKYCVLSFPSSSSGPTFPSKNISGPLFAKLNAAYGIIVKDGYIYVSSYADSNIKVFKTTDNGDILPQRVITSTSMKDPLQLAMATDGFVKKSEHQQSGVNLSITVSKSNSTTDSEIKRVFNAPAGFELRAPLGVFEATVDSNGANGVFRFNSTSLNGTIGDVRLLKCFEVNGSCMYFGSYSSVADPDTEGSWWLEDDNDVYLSSDTTLTAGTNYWVNYVVKDNGKYDEDRTLGSIKDPAALGVVGSSGSTGCVMNPSADFGLEWLLLALATMYGLIYRKSQ